MARVALCRTDELAPGAMLCKRVAGVGEVAVARLGAGEYIAFDPHCPHARGPLAEGRLHEGVVVCPWHFFRFDLRTGEVPGAKSILKLRRYPAEVSGGEVFVDIG
jgi:nitrite reductase/ring-hydroxylating ferredoxin subunit